MGILWVNDDLNGVDPMLSTPIMTPNDNSQFWGIFFYNSYSRAFPWREPVVGPSPGFTKRKYFFSQKGNSLDRPILRTP